MKLTYLSFLLDLPFKSLIQAFLSTCHQTSRMTVSILCHFQVLQVISNALDDPKRAVRQEAVRCRQAWSVFDIYTVYCLVSCARRHAYAVSMFISVEIC